MKVTAQDVLHVADLANLELTELERERMLRDLNSILDYVDRLNELDTSQIEPMAQTSDRYGAGKTVAPVNERESGQFAEAMREDQVGALRPSLPRETALRNAPQTDGTFFKVPKVIER